MAINTRGAIHSLAAMAILTLTTLTGLTEMSSGGSSSTYPHHAHVCISMDDGGTGNG
ncbi:hypothetical protein [Embleya sp. NPDC005575]|uniref:hypothetical protein n=1 Tax=Embleya sp. NPDC005575 TaxID=3156892 RepID=UPI0033A84F9F